MKNKALYPMMECTIMVALATGLSFLTLFKLPLGGSVTVLSMLPICMLSIRRGLKWGLIGGFIYSVIQLLIDLSAVLSWGLTPAAVAGCFILDYIVAFTVLGLAGVFRKHGKVGMILGICLALALRFCAHVLSGTIIFDVWMPEEWSSPFIYSICYNGSFMLPELILTCAAAFALVSIPQIVSVKRIR
ncbi:MAG: energy-coupled thiamine transporter ThiT [Clostridia bacterium]|nr:energy-coupled thiamine transporter ThiT [Clostridia bacterium]